MDMVRWMGGLRRGESVARDARVDGKTADEARGTSGARRVELERLSAAAGGSR